MTLSNQIQTRKLLYSGQVQGVGFRFNFYNIAIESGVKGYVKNLPYGHVEAVCEGSEHALDMLTEKVAHRMSGYITSCKVDILDVPKKFKDFSILT